MVVYYSKAWGGLHLLLRAYGSAIPRTLLPSVLSTALAALLFYVPGRDYFTGIWRHPYPYTLFSFIVGFILVFRSNLSYSRFWEGRSQLQMLTAHWLDLAVKALVFESVARSRNHQGHHLLEHACAQAPASPDAGQAQAAAAQMAGQRLSAFADRLLHSASLLHALCLQHLRRDWCLANLIAHQPGAPPPPADARGLPGYRVGWLQLLRLRSCAKERMRYHRAMPLPVLGGLTAEEREMLWEGDERAGGAETETLFTGLDQAEVQSPDAKPSLLARLSMRLEVQTGQAPAGANMRAVLMYTRLHLLLAQRAAEGEAAWQPALAPPTTAGVWPLLSQGWAAFEACRKLSETPFPFPWAQMVALLLVVYSATLPVMLVGFLSSIWLVLLMNFASVLTYWSVNEVARDVEDPNSSDPNDAPLARIQFEFNQRLLTAAHAVGARTSWDAGGRQWA